MPADTRDATISTAVDGRVVLESFVADERLSAPFAVSAQVVCDDVVDFLPHLGSAVTITINRDGAELREFCGILFSADYIEEDEGGHRFHLTLGSWLQTLSRNLDYAIFQQMSALDIIKAVFEKRNCSDVDYTKLSGSFGAREYCVQYRESDFTFVSRLMEEEGIYYYFKHDSDRHTMILCNARGSHEESEYASLPFVSGGGGLEVSDDRVWLWTERVENPSQGEVALRNWDFQQPDAPLQGDYAEGDRIAGEVAEVFDFPSPFLASDVGNGRGQIILESARRERRRYVGEGDAMALACGDLLTISRHPLSRFNQEYLVIGLNYGFSGQQYRSGKSGGSSAHVTIHAVPADSPWRAPMHTPKPVARGPETAIVTGPDGEVIYTDEFGRVKVRFHWDRDTTAPENSTCFIRVSHNSAGAGFGNVILPRVGQEVIVDFLSGDPDRPIITGRVYNANRKHTYTLPDNKTRSLWRSETIGTTGQDYDGAEDPPGSEAGKNEIRMEDAEGKEELWLHAQRDRKTDVRRDDAVKLGRDQTYRVGRDRTINIKHNETKTVETGDESHTVSQGKRVVTIQQNEELTVNQGDMKTTVSMGNQSNTVSQGNQSNTISMGNKSTTLDMGNYSNALSMGDYSLKCDLGSVTVEAMQQIVLKVGANSITIDQMGVHIKGLMIDVKADIELQATGLMATYQSDVLTTVKGAIVMIN